MKKFLRNYRIVFRKEFRELLRDRRSLFWLFAPPFILPGIAICAGIFIGTQAVRIAEEGVAVIVENAEESPELVQRFEDAQGTFVVEDEEDAVVIVEIPDNFQEKLDAGETANIRIVTSDNSIITLFAGGAVRAVINGYSNDLRAERLEASGIDESFLRPIEIGEARRASESAVAVSGSGGDEDEEEGSGPGIVAAIFLPLAVTSYLVGGGIGLILDTTVGEKERQTIENILVTPANRMSVVMGKMTVVFIASLAVMGLWLAEGLLLSSLGDAGGELITQDNVNLADVAEAVINGSSSALGLILALLVLIVPFTVMLNALVMSWCAYAANYREAGLFMVLLQLGLPATVLLTIFSFPADVGLTVYGLPLFGTIVAIRDLFSSNLSVSALIVNVVATSAYSVGSIWLAAWVFGREWSLTRGLQ